ncbi:hypothetical protein ACJX0J_017658, partial [Zea mays]
QMGKIRSCTALFTKGRAGAHKLARQVMVNRNGLLPKVIPRTQRTVNIHHLMIRHVLGHLCIMVVEIISTAALQPRKRQNPPLTTKGTRKIQSQILMATGGKAHFITKRTWWPLLGEQ